MSSYLKIRLISTACSLVYTASVFLIVTVFLKSNGFKLEYNSENFKIQIGSDINSKETDATTSSLLGTPRHNSTMTELKCGDGPKKIKITKAMVQKGRQNLKPVRLPRTDSGLCLESL